MRLPTALALPVLGAVFAATLAQAPAYADRVTHVDAAHDVRANRDGSGTSTAAPHRHEPDILRVTVAHTLSQLRLRVRVAELSPKDNYGEIEQIQTPTFTAGVYVTRIARLDLTSVSLIRGAGHLVACPRLRYGMDVEAGVVRVVVPRGCLDSPAWVKVGFAMSRTTTHVAFSDDGLSPALGGAPVLTRRLYPG